MNDYTHYMAGVAEVAAVHDDQALAFLDRLELRSAYENGDLRCSVCAESLSEAGLGAARGVGDNKVEFVCAKLDCQEEFYSR